MPAVAVTPAGVRDGDPAALIGLCSARGPSVLAYCRHVAGDAAAAAAAADAFARFRAAVVATDDLADLNPEALLISATRNAAAEHVDGQAQEECAEVPALLAARADKTASAADLERLERHLEGCWACRAPVARFKAAERAYRDPPDPTLDPEIAAQIFVALATAAPARDAEPPARAPAPSPNGGGHRRRAPAAGVLPVIGGDDDATTEHETLDALDPKPARGRFAARAPLGPRRPRTATAAARPPLLEPGARAARPALRLPALLPIGLVALALLVALFVSGVFGGSDPASGPGVPAPTAAPSDTPPADVVAVPGAKEASARAVEIAKARDRERERAKREHAAAPQRKAAAGTPATPPPPPAAAPTPPPAATATPPPAAPAKKAPKANANTGGAEGGGSSKINAGNGATGSEQIPPAQDSTNVPDLAPPPEPATTP